MAFHGPETLNEEHAHAEYTMVVGVIAENNYEYHPPDREPQVSTNWAPLWVSYSHQSHVHRKSEMHTVSIRPRIFDE